MILAPSTCPAAVALSSAGLREQPASPQMPDKARTNAIERVMRIVPPSWAGEPGLRLTGWILDPVHRAATAAPAAKLYCLGYPRDPQRKPVGGADGSTCVAAIPVRAAGPGDAARLECAGRRTRNGQYRTGKRRRSARPVRLRGGGTEDRATGP